MLNGLMSVNRRVLLSLIPESCRCCIKEESVTWGFFLPLCRSTHLPPPRLPLLELDPRTTPASTTCHPHPVSLLCQWASLPQTVRTQPPGVWWTTVQKRGGGSKFKSNPNKQEHVSGGGYRSCSVEKKTFLFLCLHFRTRSPSFHIDSEHDSVQIENKTKKHTIQFHLGSFRSEQKEVCHDSNWFHLKTHGSECKKLFCRLDWDSDEVLLQILKIYFQRFTEQKSLKVNFVICGRKVSKENKTHLWLCLYARDKTAPKSEANDRPLVAGVAVIREIIIMSPEWIGNKGEEWFPPLPPLPPLPQTFPSLKTPEQLERLQRPSPQRPSPQRPSPQRPAVQWLSVFTL